ncbi:MAG TPA: hypothetical protein VIO39_00715 [Methylotenera sp.]
MLIDSGNVQVKRNRKYEPIVEKLCSRRFSHSNKPIFVYIKDLMVFAAMVGYSHDVTEELEAEPIQIILNTYASDEKDGFIYLIALLQEKNAECLKDGNITDSVKYFERFCNGGLSVIKGWLDENPGDSESVDTLVDKIFEQIIKNNEIISSSDLPQPVF